jgi:hypothetical protein
LAPRYLYRKRKPKRWFETHAQDNAWHAMHLGLFTI